MPTSGMRACTAVVTEISYREGTAISAEVSFINRAEMGAELDVLKDDIRANVDKDGRIMRPLNAGSEAGIAWQKVSTKFRWQRVPIISLTLSLATNEVEALWPTLGMERLVSWNNDQVNESSLPPET